ncbi:MAG: septum formation initiator family protein [Syntrophales bacterium]|nr:septum formation initiator family protein [Syntrophales bacterium]
MKIGRFVLVIVFIFLIITVFGNRGLRDNYFLRQRLAAIKQTNCELALQNSNLARTVELLKTDPVYIEKIARDELGMVKKGDIIYRFSR